MLVHLVIGSEKLMKFKKLYGIKNKIRFGILLFIVSLYLILNVTSLNYSEPSYIGGFDLYFKNDNQTSMNEYKGFIYMVASDTDDIKFSLMIQENNSFIAIPDNVIIYFPGNTADYELISNKSRIDISRDIKKHYNPSTGLEKIEIDTRRFDDFHAIGFSWINGVKQTGYSKYRVKLPFQAPDNEDNKNFVEVLEYNVNFVAPYNKNMESSFPQPITYQTIGKREMYNFEIEIEKSDFKIFLTDYNEEGKGTFLLIFYSALLGMSIVLIIEYLIELKR